MNVGDLMPRQLGRTSSAQRQISSRVHMVCRSVARSAAEGMGFSRGTRFRLQRWVRSWSMNYRASGTDGADRLCTHQHELLADVAGDDLATVTTVLFRCQLRLKPRP